MASEFTLTPATTNHRVDIVRPEKAPDHATTDKSQNALEAIAARRQKFVEQIARQEGLDKGRLVIEKDSDTGRFVHKLVDPDSGDVIRQWPDEEWLSFARQVGGAPGLYLDEKI